MSLFTLFSIVVTLAAVAAYLNVRFVKLPTTIGVMLLALAASVLLNVAAPFVGGLRDHAASMMRQVNFDAFLLHGMLAFLLFAGAIHVEFTQLREHWKPIALLAIVGTLLSTFIVGGLTWLVLGWIGLPISVMHAMLFGALISPTDPISVIYIMKSVGAPRALETQLAGESLFNDGIGVVIFLVLLELSGFGHATTAGDAHVDASRVGLLLVREVGGAVALGLASGSIAYLMLKRVDHYQTEVLITLALAMGGYALAEALHISAPITVIVAGIFTGNQGRHGAMSDRTAQQIDLFWELIDEILNAVLFLLLGLAILLVHITGPWLIATVIVIPIVLLARAACVIGLVWPLARVAPQPRGAIPILIWGSLRGGISVAMALSLPADDTRDLILTLTYGVVIFSIVAQGLTIGPVIRRAADCDAEPAAAGPIRAY